MTAYEMRLSDWRSDVCSSDLQQQVETPSLIGGWPEQLRTAPRAAQPSLKARKHLEAGIEQRIARDQRSERVANGHAARTASMKRHTIAHHQVRFVARRARRDSRSPMAGVEIRPAPYRSEERRVGKECVS